MSFDFSNDKNSYRGFPRGAAMTPSCERAMSILDTPTGITPFMTTWLPLQAGHSIVVLIFSYCFGFDVISF